MDDPKRARSWKRRPRPRISLTNVAPVLYSTLIPDLTPIPDLWINPIYWVIVHIPK
jgi:hypothetical protein